MGAEDAIAFLSRESCVRLEQMVDPCRLLGKPFPDEGRV